MTKASGDDDRLHAFLAKHPQHGNNSLRSLIWTGDGYRIRHRLIEQVIDAGGILREMTEYTVARNGGLLVRPLGTVIVAADGSCYWSQPWLAAAGLRYACFLAGRKTEPVLLPRHRSRRA